LSEVPLREFGNLGKLIQKENYFDPVYEVPTLPEKMTSAMQYALTLEAIKEHQRSVEKIKNEGSRFLA
jgi:hypothetical protein